MSEYMDIRTALKGKNLTELNSSIGWPFSFWANDDPLYAYKIADRKALDKYNKFADENDIEGMYEGDIGKTIIICDSGDWVFYLGALEDVEEEFRDTLDAIRNAVAIRTKLPKAERKNAFGMLSDMEGFASTYEKIQALMSDYSITHEAAQNIIDEYYGTI